MEEKNTVLLSNGVEMPLLGYGVYQVTPEACEAENLNAFDFYSE